jgi:fumarate reductase subunit D
MFDHCRVCKILEIEYLIIFVYLPTFNLVHDKDQTIPIPYAPITKLILLMAVLISLFEGLQDLDSLLHTCKIFNVTLLLVHTILTDGIPLHMFCLITIYIIPI